MVTTRIYFSRATSDASFIPEHSPRTEQVVPRVNFGSVRLLRSKMSRSSRRPIENRLR